MKWHESPEFVQFAHRTPVGSILRHDRWPRSWGPFQGRRLAHFCFSYTLGGKTHYEDLNGRRPLVPGDLLLVHPGVPHRYGNGSRTGWDEYFVVFDGPIFKLWQTGIFDPRNPIIHLEPVSYWHQRLASCVESHRVPGMAHQLQQVVNLLGFMTEVIEAQLTQDSSRADAWLSRACQKMESDLGTAIDWNIFAREFGFSAEKFRKLFTHAMGITPVRYRAARIMNRACELLAKEHKLGKEIADELGFASEAHFFHRFHQMTGLTVTEFRTKPERAEFPETKRRSLSRGQGGSSSTRGHAKGQS